MQGSTFGAPLAGRTYTSASYRYGFNGKEKFNEIVEGDVDFGARMYDSRLGRWLGIDPKAGKYSFISPYVYVVNSPLRVIDPDGKDVIVLSDKEGANGTGHQAVLIGNDKDGWTYISKDGYTGESGTEASEPYYVVKKFSSLEEFRNSPHNFQLESGHHSTTEGDEAATFDYALDDDGNKIQRYDEALYIGTTQADGSSTDQQAIDAATKVATSDYVLTSSDCSDVITAALSVTKSSEGKPIVTGELTDKEKESLAATGAVVALYYSERPNSKQDRIESKNPGTAVRADESIKPDSVKAGIGTAGRNVGNVGNKSK